MTVLDRYPWVGERFEVLRSEQNGAYVVARCPLKCHETATVRLWVYGDPPALCFKCWAGCDQLEILRAVGASWKDCFPAGADLNRIKQHIVARYDYHDEQGALLYQTVRLEPGRGGRDKEFRQRRKNPEQPGKWIWNLEGVRRILYNLYAVMTCPPDEPVIVVAGEKDADTLYGIGIVATTNVCGERSEWLDDYSRFLTGRHVIVVEDRDSAGKRHVHEIVGSLIDHDAASVRRVRFAGAKDSTAMVNQCRMLGVHDRDELRSMFFQVATDCPVWESSGVRIEVPVDPPPARASVAPTTGRKPFRIKRSRRNQPTLPLSLE